MVEDTKKIQWVNIFKAITIILVVIGHSTAKYNNFIYQFHMAAFFFISGYTTDLKKRNFQYTIWYKLCTLILPYLSLFLVGTVLMTLMQNLGLYQLIFDGSFIGFKNAISQLILYGNNYVFWMGAGWFIIALFGAVITQKIIFTFCGSEFNYLYIISSCLLFILGYYLVRSSYHFQISIFSTDLIFIAQFYFFIGIIFRKYKFFEILCAQKMLFVTLEVITLASLYYFAFNNHATVDYPSRQFGNIFINAISAINGTLVIFWISYLLYILLPKNIVSKVAFIGENTIGILYFHFMFFKLGFLILYIFDIIPIEYLKNFIPTLEIGNNYWLLLILVSITSSIVLWKFLMKFKLNRILLGQEKNLYLSIYKKVEIYFKNLISTSRILNYIESKCLKFNKAIEYKRCIKSVVLLIIITCILSIVNLENIILKITNEVGYDIESSEKINGYYDDGWVEDYSEFRIRTKESGLIKLEGYYPFELNGEQTGTIFINNKEVKKFYIDNQIFSVEVESPKNSVVLLQILCDFVYIPEPPDIRKLSFILTDISGK